MENLNFYDYILFPNRAERDKVRATFYDTKNLRLDERNYSEISVNGVIPSFALFIKYNELNTKIMNFNNTVVYLDLAILQMVNYFDLLSSTSNGDEHTIYEFLYRQSCRNVCCEIYTYEEKIKDFLRYVLGFDLNGTRNVDAFIKELKNKCKGLPYGQDFMRAVTSYHKNSNVSFVKNIRDDEIHNTTHLIRNFDDNSGSINQDLYNKICSCLFELEKLKNAFQDFLNLAIK